MEMQEHFVHDLRIGKQLLPGRLVENTSTDCVINTGLSFLQLCSARGSQKASIITRIKPFPLTQNMAFYSYSYVEFN